MAGGDVVTPDRGAQLSSTKTFLIMNYILVSLRVSTRAPCQTYLLSEAKFRHYVLLLITKTW